MPAKSAGQAIKIANQIIREAGYAVFQITGVKWDNDGNAIVKAYSGAVNITVTIDSETAEVLDFETDS